MWNNQITTVPGTQLLAVNFKRRRGIHGTRKIRTELQFSVESNIPCSVQKTHKGGGRGKREKFERKQNYIQVYNNGAEQVAR